MLVGPLRPPSPPWGLAQTQNCTGKHPLTATTHTHIHTMSWIKCCFALCPTDCPATATAPAAATQNQPPAATNPGEAGVLGYSSFWFSPLCLNVCACVRACLCVHMCVSVCEWVHVCLHTTFYSKGSVLIATADEHTVLWLSTPEVGISQLSTSSAMHFQTQTDESSAKVPSKFVKSETKCYKTKKKKSCLKIKLCTIK